MGAVSRIALLALRIWQLICSTIVVGILARFLHVLSEAGAARDSRVIYGNSCLYQPRLCYIVFIAPFLYSFLAFPVDFALFIMSIVLFCLLITLTFFLANGYQDMQFSLVLELLGYYWGGWWRDPFFIDGPGDIAYRGCGHWRTVLAFSFMALFAYLLSAGLGVYALSRWWATRKRERQVETTTTT
ncbi:hypothetical protein B0I37DRAFT_435427 [Chaetomium sp. MPI-CAGE-AT-0009]|nr:hypothetical protein B0I37DRAFT_435427 [Chaetomium sp. MPI-CAGE-AT-0009]